MRCLSCKYDLRKLPVHRCPECGRAFNPKDPATFGPYRKPKWPRFVIAGVVLYLALFGYSLYGVLNPTPPIISNRDPNIPITPTKEPLGNSIIRAGVYALFHWPYFAGAAFIAYMCVSLVNETIGTPDSSARLAKDSQRPED